MAFRVCCSCKNPPGPSEGFVSRLCRVTQTLGTVIGDEEYFWTPVSGAHELWDILIPTTTPGTYLLEGFRVEWIGPTENGQRFNGILSNITIPPTAEELRTRVGPMMFPKILTGSTSNTSSSWYPGGGGITGELSQKPSSLFRSSIPFGGHVSNDAVRGIVFPQTATSNSVALGGFLYADINPAGIPQTINFPGRLRYWRLLENGVPVSDVMNGYTPAARTEQRMYPIADVSTSTWACTSGTEFWSIIDRDPIPYLASTSEYIWSTELNAPITLEMQSFTYTGGDNYVTVHMQATVVDVSGALASTGIANILIELLYDGEVIAEGIQQAQPGGTWQLRNQILSAPQDRFYRSKDSSNFIPVDADPTKFKLRIKQTASSTGRHFAIAALQVASIPFDYYVSERTTVEPIWWWPINRANWIPWRKNKRLGFDLWFEVTLGTSTNWRSQLGRLSQRTDMYEGATATVAHGVIGIRTCFLPEFDLVRDSFKIRFLNGTWRPIGRDLDNSDTLTFRPSTNPFWGNGSDTVGWHPGWSNGSIGLIVNQDVPEIYIKNVTINGVLRDRLRYIPEDTGHAVTNFKFRANNTLGDVYVNVQTPGGIWKYTRPTKFVLERPCQTSATNSFTPQEYEDIEGFPTEIEVSIAKPPRTYTYTEDDTWTCPDHVTSVTVECFGGGGGGGGTDGDTGSSAGGGGGGGYSKYTNLTVTPGETYDITVGAGGTAGTLGGGNGGNGSATEFSYSGSALCKALGGIGGQGATAENASPGGSGASTGSAVGTTKFSGGNGAAGATNGTGVNGGGGGSSGAPSGNGTNATNSTGATKAGAGSGGSGRSVPVLTPLPGTAGSPPGGGGGGGVAWDALGSTGYAGGDGRLTLTY